MRRTDQILRIIDTGKISSLIVSGKGRNTDNMIRIVHRAVQKMYN